MREPEGKEVDMWSYFRIFQPMVWLVIMGISILAIILTCISFSRSSSESCDQVTRVLSLLSKPLEPQSRGQKSLILTLWVFAYLIIAHFNAQVTTFMTVSERIPLKNYIDTLEARFSPIVFGSSSFYTLLQNSKPGSDLNKVYTQRFQSNPDSLVWSVNDTQKRMLEKPNTVLFNVEATYYPGCYAVPLDWYVKNAAGFGLQKDSEFKRVFDNLGLKIQESGIFKKIRKRVKREILVKNEAAALGIRELTFPFTCLAIGGFLAGILAVLERIIISMFQKPLAH